jgi:ABC-type Co2+ transport system permease subunit
MYFDKVIFLYALYVAFAYSILAFGATYFREVADREKKLDIDIGETLIYAINASSYAVITYVIPLAIFVNTLQILIRASFQKTAICVKGIQLRYMLKSGINRLKYNSLTSIQIEPFFVWFKVILFCEHAKSGHCYINSEQLDILMNQINNYPSCEIIHDKKA